MSEDRPEAFERRDSLRRYASIRLTPPGGDPVETKGVISLKGIFLEGAQAIPESWYGATVAVEADLGSVQRLRASCLVSPPPPERATAGHLLTWQPLDFEAERELARYLDEAAGRS
jgi:hypothetical protein